jgi:long-subunit acyl-CoA synthetase (AMP-forming)
VPERSVCLFLTRSSFPLVASYVGTVAANCVPAVLYVAPFPALNFCNTLCMYEDVADADLVHIANDSMAAVVFVASQPISDRSPLQLPDKFVQSILPKLPHCRHVVLLPPDSLCDAGVLQKLQAEANLLASKFSSKSVSPGEERRSCAFHSWADCMALGPGAHHSAFEQRSSNIHADSCCCVCYGTGASRSRPVGSMLSHDNMLWTARVLAENFLRLQAGDVLAATLPMAMALGQVVYIAASIQAASILCFPRATKAPYDVSLSFLVESQPHVLLCTPLQLKSLISEIEKLPTASQAAQGAKNMALDGGRAAALGQSKPRFYGWNRRTVYKKIWAAAGLARCKFLGSYGDVCPQLLTERFLTIGMCLCNVYGCNEATGIVASTKNDPMRPQLPLANEWRFGEVGRCIPGCQVRLVVDAQQPGKLLFSGRNTFMGYLNRGTPSTADGFFDTGDWAFSDAGFIGIEGRGSDRIVLNTGASVHAASVQAAIEQGLPGTLRAMLVGHALPHVSVICEFEQDSSSGSLSEACINWQRSKFANPAMVQVTVSGALGSDIFKRQVAVALHVSSIHCAPQPHYPHAMSVRTCKRRENSRAAASPKCRLSRTGLCTPLPTVSHAVLHWLTLSAGFPSRKKTSFPAEDSLSDAIAF